MTVQYDAEKMRFACWIPMATGTHSEYVIQGVQIKSGPLTKP